MVIHYFTIAFGSKTPKNKTLILPLDPFIAHLLPLFQNLILRGIDFTVECSKFDYY